MQWRMVGFVIAVCWVLVAPVLQHLLGDDSKHRARLSAGGIDPSAAGLHKFFAEVTNDSPDEAVVQRIEQLGSANYDQRIAAQQFLMRQAHLPLDQLRKAADSSNAEVAYRVAIVLKNWIPERERNIESALWLIAEERLDGFAPDIFNVVSLFRDQQKIVHAAELALVGSVRDTDQPLLRAHITGHDTLLAHLSLSGFIAIAEARHADQLLAWSEESTFAAADRLKLILAVARLKDLRALPSLVDLLQTSDQVVRQRANVALQKLTGQMILLNPGDPASVEQATNQWRQWLAKSEGGFEMNVERLDANSQRSNLHGNLLLALGYKNQVVELNPAGEEVWKFDALGVWSAEKTITGDVLLACYQENKVKLVTPQKTVSWEFDVPGVLKAHYLETHNVLAASHSGNKVIEISPDKKIVWEYTATTQCHDALRLENGNTLVCAANQVIEVDPGGNVVWGFPAEQSYGIDVLPNGNLLVAKLGGEVIEVDRVNNAIVWTFEFASPVDVFRTDEGTTLITGAQSVVEIDAEKNVLWTKDICNFGSARK